MQNTDQNQFSEVAGSAVGDHPTAHDTLGFGPYVDAVFAFLTSEATMPPFTISVEGDWGSGKSSFMMQLQQKIAGRPRREVLIDNLPPWLGGSDDGASVFKAMKLAFQEERRCTIQFNAWRHDKQDALWAAFALSVSKRLRARVGFLRAWRGDIQLFWSRVAFPRIISKLIVLAAIIFLALVIVHHYRPNSPSLKHILATAAAPFEMPNAIGGLSGWLQTKGFWGALALAFLGAFISLKKIQSPMEKQLQKYLVDPKYAEHTDFIETFHQDFARVISAYAGDQRVFIFIDDLDRCDVPKAAELMQAINLMIGESGSLIFILGMDREKVAAGIAQKYKDLIAFLPEHQSSNSDNESATDYLRFGSSYLEKFIQLTFNIPTISSQQSFNRFLAGLVPEPPPLGWRKCFFAYWGRRLSKPSPKPDLSQLSIEGTVPDVQTGASTAEREERVQQIQIRIGTDAPGIRIAANMVAPVFGNNPRRLKQFVSAFRLALSIYSSQGIFDLRDNKAAATPQQIAKVIALLLKFPDLRLSLSENPTLFAQLEKDALQNANNPWIRNEGVKKLLKYGVEAPEDAGQNNPFSLHLLDVSSILTVLPRRLYKEPAPPSGLQGVPLHAEPPQEIQRLLRGFASEYEQIRKTQLPGGDRTAAMTDIVFQIQGAVDGLAPDTVNAILNDSLSRDADGDRIVALAIAEQHVSQRNLVFLLKLFDDFRSPFEHYWCIQALIAHSPFFTVSQAQEILRIYDRHIQSIQSDPGRSQDAQRLAVLAQSIVEDVDATKFAQRTAKSSVEFSPPQKAKPE